MTLGRIISITSLKYLVFFFLGPEGLATASDRPDSAIGSARGQNISSQEYSIFAAAAELSAAHHGEKYQLWQRTTSTPSRLPPDCLQTHGTDPLFTALMALPNGVLMQSEVPFGVKLTDRVAFTRQHVVTTFSRVSFSADSSTALVYEQSSCGPLCGGGNFRLFRRDAGGWRFVKNYCVWAS